MMHPGHQSIKNPIQDIGMMITHGTGVMRMKMSILTPFTVLSDGQTSAAFDYSI
jgi:hypothetical protein